MTCTPEEHTTEVVTAARAAYHDGKQAGQLEGHRLGFDQGYLAGHDDGIRSTNAYKVAAQNEWINGYLTRISDEIATRGGAA